jgi:aarF domain-containing kinase
VAKQPERVSYRKLLKIIKRALEVALKLLPLWLSHALRSSPAVGSHAVRSKVVSSRKDWLAKLVATLAGMGPMGIKWGQWASTRYDLFEDDVCEALNELTNMAPEHSFEVTKETVERAFGGVPLESLFESFEIQPVASGSIAQVD